MFERGQQQQHVPSADTGNTSNTSNTRHTREEQPQLSPSTVEARLTPQQET